jgi:hypothetical protein
MLSDVELQYYEKGKYKTRRFKKPMELLSLQGNISLKEGKPFIHVHAALPLEVPNFMTRPSDVATTTAVPFSMTRGAASIVPPSTLCHVVRPVMGSIRNNVPFIVPA